MDLSDLSNYVLIETCAGSDGEVLLTVRRTIGTALGEMAAEYVVECVSVGAAARKIGGLWDRLGEEARTLGKELERDEEEEPAKK